MVGVTGEDQALANIWYCLCKWNYLGMESICLYCQNLWPLALCRRLYWTLTWLEEFWALCFCLDRLVKMLCLSLQRESWGIESIIHQAGSKGKTTTSWLVRGIFEEMQLVTGMVGTLEYSLAVDKMTENGDLWKPEEEDITLERSALMDRRQDAGRHTICKQKLVSQALSFEYLWCAMSLCSPLMHTLFTFTYVEAMGFASAFATSRQVCNIKQSNNDAWFGVSRECSTAFYLTPYRGKYEPPPTTPDTLRSQMVLAGMADRGATACVYEADLLPLQNGWYAPAKSYKQKIVSKVCFCQPAAWFCERSSFLFAPHVHRCNMSDWSIR